MPNLPAILVWKEAISALIDASQIFDTKSETVSVFKGAVSASYADTPHRPEIILFSKGILLAPRIPTLPTTLLSDVLLININTAVSASHLLDNIQSLPHLRKLGKYIKYIIKLVTRFLNRHMALKDTPTYPWLHLRSLMPTQTCHYIIPTQETHPILMFSFSTLYWILPTGCLCNR